MSSTALSATAVARPLRILHVVPTYYPAVRYGGPIRSVHGLAAALKRRGHDVHVYTTSMDGDDNLDVPLDTPVDLDGVTVRYFRVPFLRRLHWSPGLERRLRQSVSEFDVVHLHSVFLWPTWAAARAAARAGIPYISTPRGMLVRDMIVRKSRLAKSLWINLAERPMLARAAGVHVTAALERDELLSFGWPLPQIRLLPNGVDSPDSPAGRASGPFATLPDRYVLFLSRISWKKGLDRLIRAWQAVPEGISLVIAGNDDEGYTPKLQALVSQLGLAARVVFAGPVADEHKWALYADARLFVLPSYSENFGNVVAEAMAMGCPVLVSPEVGIAELVASSGAGIVCDCDPPLLAQRISAALADAPSLARMGARGRDTARSSLSWNGVAQQAEAFYRHVMLAT
jgi:glycosyltransferase involved in cell wall biosynthesis